MKPHLQRFQHCGIENGFNEIPWLGGFNRVNDSDPYLGTVGVVGTHLTKFRAESHDAADKNAWGSIDQRVGRYCSKTGARKLMHERLSDDCMSWKIKREISEHCSFRQTFYLLWRLHHVLVLPTCIATLFAIWIHWPQASISFSEDEFEYMKNLDPVRDSEMLLIYPNIKIRPTFNQPCHAPSIWDAEETCDAFSFQKNPVFHQGLPDVECLLDNPVHRDPTDDNPFDPYMLDDLILSESLGGLKSLMATVWMHFKIAPPSAWTRKDLHQQLKLEKQSHLQILKLAVDGSDGLKYDGGDSKRNGHGTSYSGGNGNLENHGAYGVYQFRK
ncbi:hypothetical protein PVL29_019583 [Vitis rotundifolia]|uniref:1-phosphatidylinositol 4-kinase n=1 Tax=Vitis rotundifolia TaxID=103349 RepID=A0AA38Z1C3_VITRO|nr:hypothetical protein PVL29_019583 [Vitis rotundifolia]